MINYNHSINERRKKVNPINLMQDMSFFTATLKLKELTLLQYIEENPDTTQKEMGEIIGAAPSMINVYLKEYEEKNLLKREYISSKVVNYRITPEGVKRKNYLLITYLHELLKLYRLAKENVESFFDILENEGYKHILLYGAGEVAETILGIVKDREGSTLEVIALIDDDVDRQDGTLLGYKVTSRDKIKDYEHDAIVVTSYTYEDDIREKLDEVGYPKDKVVRFFSE